MIKIINDGNKLSIKCSVTEFVFGTTYCEYKIPFYIKDIKPPKHLESEIRKAVGREYHSKEEIKEKESGRVKSITIEELRQNLPYKQNEIEFIREDIYSKLSYTANINGENVELILSGRPDKILRKDGFLIAEEDKFPVNPFIYLSKSRPFDNHKLQALIYLNSKFSISKSEKRKNNSERDKGQSTIDQFGIEIESNNYDPVDWFEIAHEKKKWIINIRKSEDTENNIIKRFEGIQDGFDDEYLSTTMWRFILLVLDKIEKCHHGNFKKCRPCEYEQICNFRLT